MNKTTNEISIDDISFIPAKIYYSIYSILCIFYIFLLLALIYNRNVSPFNSAYFLLVRILGEKNQFVKQ